MPETRSFFVSSEDLVIGFPMCDSKVTNINLTNYSKKKKLLIKESHFEFRLLRSLKVELFN